MTRELTEAVRTAKFEVAKVAGEWKDVTKRWFVLSDQAKEVVNCIWQTWLVWHVQNGSADLLRTWLDARQTDGVKAAGKCPVQPMPSELSKLIWATLAKQFPNINARSLTLLMNTTVRDLKTHKAAKGSLPGHTAILLCHQSIPSSTRSQPILFDSQPKSPQCRLIGPDEPDGNWQLEIRLWRLPSDTKKSPSITDTIELRCKGRRVQSQVAILRRISDGSYKFCGSELCYDSGKRKWFAHLCYRMPTKPRTDLDYSRVATLIPHRDRPWNLILPGTRRRVWPGGRGDYVAGVRQRVFLQRRSRAREYRAANTNRKGHGRRRALAWRWKLQATWNDFVKRVNHQVTTEVVRRLVAENVGTLAYFQPEGEFGESRFLSTAGKDECWNDATTWQWFQAKTMLSYKCQAVGIRLLDGSDGRQAIVGEAVEASRVQEV